MKSSMLRRNILRPFVQATSFGQDSFLLGWVHKVRRRSVGGQRIGGLSLFATYKCVRSGPGSLVATFWVSGQKHQFDCRQAACMKHRLLASGQVAVSDGRLPNFLKPLQGLSLSLHKVAIRLKAVRERLELGLRIQNCEGSA